MKKVGRHFAKQSSFPIHIEPFGTPCIILLFNGLSKILPTSFNRMKISYRLASIGLLYSDWRSFFSPSCAINNQVDYFTDYWVVCKRNQCHGNGLRKVNPVLSLESGRSPHSFLFVGSGGGSFEVLKPPSVHGSSLANSDKRWRCDEYCETYWDLPAAHWAGFNMLTGRRHTLALRCTVMVQSWTSDLIWSY